MVTGRRQTWLTVAIGVVVVVVGVVVLQSGAAQAEVGWFSYDGPPAPEVVEGLVAWSTTRAVGAVLVLVGLTVLAHLLGVAAGRRSAELAARLAGPALVLAGLFVVGGLVAFFVAGAAPAGTRSSAWTRDQVAAALLVATGLVVGAVGTGLRRRNTAQASEGSLGRRDGTGPRPSNAP